jgi:hypothetical protein
MKVVIISAVQHGAKLLAPAAKPVEIENDAARELLKAGAACLPGEPGQLALMEAEEAIGAQAKAAAAAAAAVEKEAKAAAAAAAQDAWDGDEALRATFKDFAEYLASLKD